MEAHVLFWDSKTGKTSLVHKCDKGIEWDSAKKIYALRHDIIIIGFLQFEEGYSFQVIDTQNKHLLFDSSSEGSCFSRVEGFLMTSDRKFILNAFLGEDKRACLSEFRFEEDKFQLTKIGYVKGDELLLKSITPGFGSSPA